MSYVLAGLAGLGVAAVTFLLVVLRTWVRVSLDDRARALKALKEGERMGAERDLAAQGAFLYRCLADLAMVDYEKDAKIRTSVARVLRQVRPRR